MSELNKKLETYRNIHRNNPNYKDIQEVLNQLLVIGFNNENKPNELPNEFTIKLVKFRKSNFEALMLDIGFKVIIQEKFLDFYSKLCTIKVTLVQIKKN